MSRITSRYVKKRAKRVLKSDNTFHGIRVYTYEIENVTVCTSRPVQKGSKAYPLKYVLWLHKYYSKVMSNTCNKER